MYLDESLPGGGPGGPWCRACKKTIHEGEEFVRVRFDSDPHGAEELSGPYHAACSRPFVSMERALSALSRLRR